jgi:zinc/manganese transport system substrate-binding protein
LAVLGTENFYADLLAQIGGPHVRAASLLNDPNADPHAFETNPQDAALVADARIVIVNGIGYDDFMQQLLGAAPDPSRVVIDVQQLLGVADDVNVHIWYDPATMPKVAQAATAALSQLDPADAPYYQANEQAYVSSLQPLTAEIALLKTRYSGAPIAFTEPVAGYVAAAVGLRVLTPEGFQKAIEEGTDPAPADVAAEEDLLTGRKVKVLIYNSQVTTPITQRMKDLAAQNGIPVVGVAETMPPAYAHYADWQLAQLQALQAALAQGS